MTNGRISRGRGRGWRRGAAARFILFAAALSFATLGHFPARPAGAEEPGGKRGAESGDAAAEAKPLERVGRIDASRLREASGLARSRTQDGVFWSLTDSGGPPHLFALDRTGKLLAEYRVSKVVNIDWETIEADANGQLYVGDTGNNLPVGEPLSRRFIYRLREPRVPKLWKAGAQPLSVDVERMFTYEFPDEPFDVEGMVVVDALALLVRKERGDDARVYQLDLSSKASPQKLVNIGKLPGVTRVTGADLSPDGRTLAVCSVDRAALYQREKGAPIADFIRAEPRVFRYPACGIEGCAFDGESLLFCDEDRTMYRLALPGLGK